MPCLTESEIEIAALQWLEELGWSVARGEDVASDTLFARRSDYKEVILGEVLCEALQRLNPHLPEDAIQEAQRKLIAAEGSSLLQRNRNCHRLLTEGIPVEVRTSENLSRGMLARAIDFENPDNNSWLAINQFTVAETSAAIGKTIVRRPDIVLFVNGLPLAVIELKNAADANATIWHAYQQLQTYQNEIPSLFVSNEILVISDGIEARVGPLGAGREWFKPWRTIGGDAVAPPTELELKVALAGIFDKRRFLDLVRDFIVFEDDGSGKLMKKMAGYHQFHAVQVAVEETLRAAILGQKTTNEVTKKQRVQRSSRGKVGDRRIGVIWHTQGSGKSLTMVFYAGRIIREPAMENPTVVVLTDRNDLDDQLFNTFSRCQDLLRQRPVQAESRAHLRQLLAVQSGGVVFTTIQKFFPEKGERHPELSQRRNIVVIADEAHRSQYDFIDGFARHMRDALPNASFIGFTGTPIEKEDANTRAVFGDYISIYDIEQSVKDGATVPIYYESRLAKLALPEELKPQIDREFEEVTEGEEVERKEKLKTKWAQLEKIVGSEKRLRLVANDIVAHFEQRLEILEGKAMIVCMSRRICVDLYNEIIKIRPSWHGEKDEQGIVKIVMTGSAGDPAEWQIHIRNKERREQLANRFRDPSDPFRLVIVRDMWLTGFDCPSLHTIYIDKPMRGHGLMQAIARVNRVFRDKPGGLVVDYIGIARELKEALATYTESGGRGQTTINQEEAVAVLHEKHEICCALFHGFVWSAWKSGTATDRLALLPAAQEHILAQENGKDRFLRAARELKLAFALAVPHEEALRIRDDVAFFQTVAAALSKRVLGQEQSKPALDSAIRQIISKAIAPEGVVDIFSAAGLKKPDISILSDEFLAEVRVLPQKNLAIDILQKLLHGEINKLQRKYVVQARSFSELLENTIRRYQNRALETTEVIEELINLAKDLRSAQARGEKLGLSEEELAFYDALETNDSAVRVLGDKTLRTIAHELVETLRNNVTIDWMVRENVRAQLRVHVKRILRKYGYPPDKEERATQTVLEQAEAISERWLT
ncbi:MAG: type I restriction endonuclease subunit R [Leptospiraceae bacterium]|nr:type I restriction endonuclease subunit R [Leptospiraceae bacterium]